MLGCELLIPDRQWQIKKGSSTWLQDSCSFLHFLHTLSRPQTTSMTSARIAYLSISRPVHARMALRRCGSVRACHKLGGLGDDLLSSLFWGSKQLDIDALPLAGPHLHPTVALTALPPDGRKLFIIQYIHESVYPLSTSLRPSACMVAEVSLRLGIAALLTLARGPKTCCIPRHSDKQTAHVPTADHAKVLQT